MGMIVHRSVSADDLVDGLAVLLSRLPADADPLSSELVVVPQRGVERWLSQRIAHRLGTGEAAGGGDGWGDGVCAGVQFVSPTSFAALIGIDGSGPWSLGELTWMVLATVDTCLGEPWCDALARHLGHGETGEDADLKRRRRFATAQRLARLFISYVQQRPSMLTAWESGEDTDGFGIDLPIDLTWQPELWRRLVASIGSTPVVSHREACDAISTGERVLDLPSRLSLFGHTRLSETDLGLLRAVANSREVHLWLPHPSPPLWDEIAAAPVMPLGRRTDDQTAAAAVHPLLAAWGRDSRELQVRLALGPFEDSLVGNRLPEGGDSLLQVLQADIAANRQPTSIEDLTHDDSVQVHSCHGSFRQVDVLREILVGLLQDDPTLEPRDIIVMCPDIEVYAPLFEAAFGLGDVLSDSHPGQRLRVKLADRSLIQTNPLMAVLGGLLDLAMGRAEASRILDFLALPPVRQRFAFSEDDLEELASWTQETGIRWAFDATHRAEFGLSAFPQNTWRFGLDRLLAGVALSDDSHRWLGQALPFDGVGSVDIERVGRFVEALTRLATACKSLRLERSVGDWVPLLEASVDGLAVHEYGEEWQSAQLRRELSTLLAGAEASGQENTTLGLSDVSALVADRVVGRPTRSNFRTGSITVCTMTPMRSVPHRIVCLVGLDDGAFPRQPHADGDDVLSRKPALGDRDVRSEDRHLLLDAMLAAKDRLVMTFSGRDEVSGEVRPPAVVLGELIDVVHQMAPDHIFVREEPLQAFNADLMDAKSPRSFDIRMAAAAQAAHGPRMNVDSLAEVALQRRPPGDVDIEDLIAFFKDPVRAFLRNRLEIGLEFGDESSDQLPIEADGLVSWGVGTRALRELFEGAGPGTVLEREWRRGVLPPGRLGWNVAKGIIGKAVPIAAEALALAQGIESRTRQVEIDLGGRAVVGTVTDLFDTRVIKMTYSSLGARNKIEAWLSLVALAADAPHRAWTSGAIGRGTQGAETARITFVKPDDPVGILRDLVAIYDAGMTGPIPLPLKTAHAWADGRRSGGSRAEAWATSAWVGGRPGYGGEREKPSHVAVWGEHYPLPALLAQPPLTGEDPTDEGTRLGAFALRLWTPLFEHARVVGR